MKILSIFFSLFISLGVAQAATFTVTRTDDRNAGVCAAGDCSLREAVNAANTAAGDDTIEFDAAVFATTQVIALTNGELLINSNVNVNGRGADVVTVSGNLTNFRVFNIAAGSLVNIGNLTVTGGYLPAGNGFGPKGAGILNAGTLTVFNSKIVGNRMENNGYGIGVSNIGTMNLLNSTVSGNLGTPAMGPSIVGGGVSNEGSMNISGSTISSNIARYGGGIWNQQGVLTIQNSTIYGNTTRGAGGSGAGIYNFTGGIISLLNSTVAGNLASSSSSQTGGITVTQNSTINLNNSIVAGNVSEIQFQSTRISDISGAVNSQGNNLISNAAESSGWTIADLLNQPANLAPLDNYGGTTQTVALLPNSLAIDAGNNANASANDQRGSVRIVNGIIDIGAFENNISILPANLSKARTGVFYTQTLTATRLNSLSFNLDDVFGENSQNVSAPFTFSVALQSVLPPGLTLSAGGTISGTPTRKGRYTFTIKAVDADGMAGVRQFRITVGVPTV